jgi:hypothetical protein
MSGSAQRLDWARLLSEQRLPPENASARALPPWLVDSRTDVFFATPTRRLGDKTQVFPLEKNESVRTRLLVLLAMAGTRRFHPAGHARRSQRRRVTARANTRSARCRRAPGWRSSPPGRVSRRSIWRRKPSTAASGSPGRARSRRRAASHRTRGPSTPR